MPVLLISTFNEDGSVDVMNAAWGTMLDRDRVALNLTETHKTVQNIKARGGFVVHIADAKHAAEADYFGVVSGNKEPDKFAKSGLSFVKSDLIPAVVQEKSTGEVLMLAYMNRESLQKTFETGYTWFWSRSRQELWNKGATSGHLQKVVDVFADCDDDTLLITVEQTGAACHTGNHSCFFKKIK